MDMKKLQNNFTTPEQSKRLLELGVPAWTADLYFYEEGCISNDDEPSGVIPYDEVYQDYRKEGVFSDYAEFPCWSVGRLMEIIDECALGENPNPNTGEYPSTKKVKNKLCISYMEYLVKSIERAKQLGTIDFSKLEE